MQVWRHIVVGPLKANHKEANHACTARKSNICKMGMQISCGVHTEMSSPSPVRITWNIIGQSFWARGYYVSTVGRDEKLIREYIRNQEEQDRREDGQMNLQFDRAVAVAAFRRRHL